MWAKRGVTSPVALLARRNLFLEIRVVKCCLLVACCCLFLLWGEGCSNPLIYTPLLLRLLLSSKPPSLAPKGAKDGLLGALDGSKQGRNGPNMPRTPSQSGRDHFWTKLFLTIFGPKIHLSGVPCGGVLPPHPLARPGTGSYAGVGAVLRGGNHLNWGVAPRKSAPGIAIPAVQPEIRAFFGFDARPADGATHPAQDDPKRTQTGTRAGATGRRGPQSPSRAP